MKCIVFGLSTCRNSIEEYLNNDVEILGYSDSFSNLETFNKKKFYTVEELTNIDFDFIIIAISSKQGSFNVKSKLINMGINESKIITAQDYIKYTNYLKCSKKHVINMKVDNMIEGIILGISYGQAGIVPEILGKNFYNLALGSQDLFYNLQQIKLLKKYRPQLIKDLKYVIIDMYNYTYFNYDVSLSNNAAPFIFANGFNEIHNLKDNTDYDEKEIAFYTDDFKNEEIQKLSKVFNNSLIIRDKENYYYNSKERKKQISESEIEFIKNNKKLSSIESKLFINTEEENKNIFKELINEIYEIDPEIKIYSILLPTYAGFNKDVKIDWKSRFMDIINSFIKNYKISFFDYTYLFYNKKEYFFDPEHLNYNGAVYFTNILKKDLNI